MNEYNEVVAKYKAGLISREEANRKIDIINMGEDYRLFPRV